MRKASALVLIPSGVLLAIPLGARAPRPLFSHERFSVAHCRLGKGLDPAALATANRQSAIDQKAGGMPASRSLAAVSDIVVQNGEAGKTWVDIATTATAYHVEHMDHPWRVVVDMSNSEDRAPRHLYPVGSTLLKQVKVGQYRDQPGEHVVRVVAVLESDEAFDVQQRPGGVRIELEPRSRMSDTAPHQTASSGPGVHSPTARPAALVEHPASGQSATSPGKVEPKNTPSTAQAASVPAGAVAPPQRRPPTAPSAPARNEQTFGPEPIAQLASAVPLRTAPSAKSDPTPQGAGPTLLPAASAGASAEQQQPPAQPPASGQAPAPSSGSQAITLVPEKSAPTAARPKYTGELISMNLKDIDLKDFFRMIHEVSGLNIVVDSDVTGAVTMVLDRVPWDQALDLVLRDNGLGKTLDGNVLRIAKLDTLEKEQEESVKLADAQESAEPLVTVIIPLKYASAIDRTPTQATITSAGGGAGGGMAGGGGGGSQQQNIIIPGVVSILTGHVSSSGSSSGGGGGGAALGRSVLSKRGSAIPDTRNNSIILTEVPSRIGLVESVISKLDTPAKQVSIEARIVVANSDFVRSIQSALNFGSVNPSGSTVTGGATGTGATAQGNVPTPATGGGTTPPRVTVGQTAASGFGAFAISNQSMRYFINAAISAAETRDQAKTISAPTIVTQNNWPALVLQGVQIPIQTTINNTISTQFVDAALTLQVTPTVTEGGHLFLQLQVANNSVGAVLTGAAGPSINTQAATTQVMVPDGGTVVFGGVKVTTRTRSVTQVPVLGDLPVLGNLFKSSNVEDSDQELLFFVSPKILPE